MWSPVLSAESVLRAVNYDRFTVKTFFISQSGDFIKTQEFYDSWSRGPSMTNETIDNQVPSKKKRVVVFPSFTVRWEKMACSRILEVLKPPLRRLQHLVI